MCAKSSVPADAYAVTQGTDFDFLKVQQLWLFLYGLDGYLLFYVVTVCIKN